MTLRVILVCLCLTLTCCLMGSSALAQRLAFDKSLFEVEEGETTTIVVTLSEAASETVSVPFETATNAAQGGRDFVMRSGTLTFEPGVLEQTFEVETLDDAKFEGDETFKVILGEPTGAELSYLSDASVRILENNEEPVGLLEDFETEEPAFTSGADLETTEISAGSDSALPEQGAFERVLEVGGAGRLERRFTTAQDWSNFGALSFWYYGQRTGETLKVELASGSSEVAAQNWPLAWSDEFDGEAGTPPDPAYWNYDLGGSGWGNVEWQTYTDSSENAAMDGEGNLVISALELPEGGNGCRFGPCRHTSARLHTAGKVETLYGRVEARLKLPEGQGIWPAFWMLGNDFRSVGWPASGEIDVMEHIGREPETVYGHLHGPGYSGGGGPGGPYGDPDGFTDFHVYAVEWEPGEIRWYVDGEHYLSIGAEDVGGEWVFDHPFFILLNLAVGGTWPGNPDETTQFPQHFVADYVRVYALPDTSTHFDAQFIDEVEGWQKVTLPFAAFTQSETQNAAAPGEPDVSEVWGYSLSVPGEVYIDQITLEE